jgi:hypothetical protein
MKIAILIVFVAALSCCSGCLTSQYADRRPDRKYDDFKPAWLLVRSNDVVAINGTLNVGGTNVSSYVVIGKIEVSNDGITNHDEVYENIVNALYHNTCPLFASGLRTVDKIESDYARIGPFPSNLAWYVRVNEKVITHNAYRWNMLWTVPLDIATSPFQLIFIIAYFSQGGC